MWLFRISSKENKWQAMLIFRATKQTLKFRKMRRGEGGRGRNWSRRRGGRKGRSGGEKESLQKELRRHENTTFCKLPYVHQPRSPHSDTSNSSSGPHNFYPTSLILHLHLLSPMLKIPVLDNTKYFLFYLTTQKGQSQDNNADTTTKDYWKQLKMLLLFLPLG